MNVNVYVDDPPFGMIAQSGRNGASCVVVDTETGNLRSPGVVQPSGRAEGVLGLSGDQQLDGTQRGTAHGCRGGVNAFEDWGVQCAQPHSKSR